MKYEMDPNKSGVLIYFDPMREAADALDDERLGKLVRAILNYADPTRMTEPQFEDETLSKVWIFVRSIIIRDDKTYRVKSAKKRYAAFCRYSKEHGYDPPISREAWDNLGQPSFTEFTKWQEEQLHASAVHSNAVHSNAVHRMPTATSLSNSFSTSLSPSTAVSVSGAYAQDGSAPEGPETRQTPKAYHTLTPGLMSVYDAWTMHWEQLTGRTLPQSSRGALVEDFKTYSDEYGAEAVAVLVNEAISSAYRSIPWDRLERRRNAANRPEGGASADDTLKALYDEFGRDGV